jgi:hypothetical protein
VILKRATKQESRVKEKKKKMAYFLLVGVSKKADKLIKPKKSEKN